MEVFGWDFIYASIVGYLMWSGALVCIQTFRVVACERVRLAAVRMFCSVVRVEW